MNRKRLFYAALISGATAALTLALTLTLSPHRSRPTPAPAPAAPPLAEATAPHPQGGQHEAITVHGHWTIEVRNPDGTVATHREFENALTPNGAFHLANILGRQKTPGYWVVQLFPPENGVSPWGNSVGSIAEPNDSAFPEGPGISNNLLLSVPSDSPGRFTMTGSLAALQAGSIGNVTTDVALCAPDIPPNKCGRAGFPPRLTSASLPATVDVVAGQIVQVTVVISFS